MNGEMDNTCGPVLVGVDDMKQESNSRQIHDVKNSLPIRIVAIQSILHQFEGFVIVDV